MSNEIKNYLNKFNVSNIQRPISLIDDYDSLGENRPDSFKEWLSKHVSISPNSEYKEYNSYLKRWYESKYASKETQLQNLKNDYVLFLKDLSLLFKDDPKFKYISEIDFDDVVDIEYAIPYFTKKIKEICFYIISKRESAKKTKIKYNMVGSNQSLEKLFYQYILKAFTQKNTLINVPEFSGVDVLPQLSSISNAFQISVEELYDNTSYFDKDPSVNYSVSSQSLSSYFKDKNYTEDFEWVYDSGKIDFFDNNPIFWTLQNLLEENGVEETALLPFSSVDLSNVLTPQPNEINKSLLTKKYVGNDFYLITGGFYNLKSYTVDLPLSPQNNWFYFPSGEAIIDTYDAPVFDAIKINDTSLVSSGATFSDNYKNADKIFVQKDDTVFGAWLRYYRNFTKTEQMSCVLGLGEATEFKFPYPDYGIIGDGTSWTGRSINGINNSFSFLDSDSKKLVLKQYWNFTTNTSNICSININNTNLVNNGAFPSVLYLSADKISKRKAENNLRDNTPNEVYNDGFEYAWLYKFLKTDVPVRVGKNTIQWPIKRVEDDENQLLNVGSNFSEPINLNSIPIDNFIGSRAGYFLGDSDIIYKLNSRFGYPIECAYLKGQEISNSIPNGLVTGNTNTTFISSVTGIMQLGLNLKCKPDTPETFIWQDENRSINSLNINYKKHQDSCSFVLFEKHISLYGQKDAAEYEFIYPWKSCDCKSVYYSPIGHTGNSYEDYSGMADIVFLDTQDPLPFSLDLWRGLDGLDYKRSSDFAWYKIEKTEISNEQGLDVDVGMGVGRWVTGSGQPFVFKKGKQYKYIRTGLKRSYNELIAEVVPSLIISTKYNNSYKPEWKKAILDSNGQWIETLEPSNMIINSGDYLLYDHFESNFHCLLYDGTYREYCVETTLSSAINVDNNFWVNFTFATTGIPINFKWPDTIYTGYGPSVPATTILASQLSSVKWQVVMGATGYNTELSPEDVLTVISYTPNNILVSVSGYVIDGPVEIVTLPAVNIVSPLTTLVKSFSGEKLTKTHYSDTLNFILNTPLYGWNYNTNSYDGVSNGARPFWAEAIDDDSYTTKFKGTREWGYGLRVADEYTLIHQPPPSFMSLEYEDVLKYEKQNTAIVWVQPVDFIVNDETKEWCDLIVDPAKTSPLSSYINNVDKELVVYPTSTRSTLDLAQGDFINYWSNSDFIWSQTLVDTTVGIPPFGGDYVPFTSALQIQADVPYANLTNRHYPSIAVYPDVSQFYSERDSGGYFIPKNIGVLTYLGKNYDNIINPELSANQLSDKEYYFRDPEVFISKDSGLTNKKQSGPIITKSIDSSWMKGNITEGYKAGFINKENDYKEFSPYQTKEETVGNSKNGILSINYELDPWYSEFDNKWRDTINWPPNFRKQYPIKNWNYELNMFIREQGLVTKDRNINIKAPYFCENESSRNIISKEYKNTSCIGSGQNQVITCFNDCDILLTTNIASYSVSSDGGVILKVNNEYMQNNYLPVYKGPEINTMRIDRESVVYGERRGANDNVNDDAIKVVSYGMLGICVNGEVLYTPIYRGKKTNCEVSNLSGVYEFNSEFRTYGFLPIYFNEVEKGFIRLYEKSSVEPPSVDLLPDDNFNTNTDVYAFFDTSSMDRTVLDVAGRALTAWHSQIPSVVPNYTGNLYLIPVQESWLQYPTDVHTKTGTNRWQYPEPSDVLNYQTYGWFESYKPDYSVISTPLNYLAISFHDESNPIYHNNEINLNGEPTNSYKDHFNAFRSVFNSINSQNGYFKGVIYPVIQTGSVVQTGRTKSFLLHAMAAVYGRILTNQELQTIYTVNPSLQQYTSELSLLTNQNPYNPTNLNANPSGLINYGWVGEWNKVGDYQSIFTASSFAQELNDLIFQT